MTLSRPSPGGGAPAKVLYIIGKGRSGSTILDLVLGQVEGFFSTGELARIWEWGVLRGYRCGCGVPIPDCSIWSTVLGEIASHGVPVEDIAALQARVLSWRRVWRLLRQRPGTSGWRDLHEYSVLLSHLYRSITTTTGAAVVVDSTKWPGLPGALGLVPGIRPYVVHLVRDPRAVAHSWRRRKPWTDREEAGEMPRFGSIHTSLSWTARNLIADAVRRRRSDTAMLVRYEDFVDDPRGTVRAIVDLVGEAGLELPFTDDRTVALTGNHTVSGNPNRMREGEMRIDEDREWLRGPETLRRSMVAMLTFPLMKRYGYRSRPAVRSAG